MEKHKRYLLFTYDTYYPGGGLTDLLNSFDSVEEALIEARKNVSDYKELYDRIEGKEIDLEKYNITA